MNLVKRRKKGERREREKERERKRKRKENTKFIRKVHCELRILARVDLGALLTLILFANLFSCLHPLFALLKTLTFGTHTYLHT